MQSEGALMAKQPETGFTICRKDNKLIKGCEAVGDSPYHVSIPLCCPHGGVPVGNYHTHPNASIRPSDADFSEARRHGFEFICIAVPETRESKCYRLDRK